MAPLGFDVVVDATGSPAVVERMFQYAKPTAKILFFGVCPSEAKVSISPYDVFKNDWEIYGSFALKYTFYPALDLVSSGAVKVLPIVSHTIPLEDLPRLMRGDLPRGGQDEGASSALTPRSRPGRWCYNCPMAKLYETIRYWADGQNASERGADRPADDAAGRGGAGAPTPAAAGLAG